MFVALSIATPNLLSASVLRQLLTIYLRFLLYNLLELVEI